MRVTLRNPKRVVEFAGPIAAGELCVRLDINPDSVIVIVGDELVTLDTVLADDADVELRPVISGGAR